MEKEPTGYRPCSLCHANAANPKEVLVYEDQEVAAALSFGRKAKNLGHLVVFPRRHYRDLYDIPDHILSRIHVVSKQLALAIKKGLGCDGISLRQNNETAGDQDVFHYHLHIIPRYEGDNYRYEELEDSTLQERQALGERIRPHVTGLGE